MNRTAHIRGRWEQVALSTLHEIFQLVLQRRCSIPPKKIVARVASFVEPVSDLAREQNQGHWMKTACPFDALSTLEHTGPIRMEVEALVEVGDSVASAEVTRAWQ